MLASWRQTCKTLYRAVGAHLRERYQKCVRPFVRDIALFDSLLVRHGAVVSGSVALHYFLPRATWTPNDLDIYVPESDFEDFVDAITNRRGLNFTVFPHRRPWDTIESPQSASSQFGDTGSHDGAGDARVSRSRTPDAFVDPNDFPEPSRHNGIREVRQFYTAQDRRVDVISVPSPNPVAALQHFWASLVMNFLRPDVAVCGFPLTTLECVGILKPVMTAKDEKAADKYGTRGFDLLVDPPLPDEQDWERPFFGTRKALVAPYRRTLQERPPTSPLIRTDRGWALSTSWPPPVGECDSTVSLSAAFCLRCMS